MMLLVSLCVSDLSIAMKQHFVMVLSSAHPAVLATQVVTAMMYSWRYGMYVDVTVETDVGMWQWNLKLFWACHNKDGCF